MTQQEMTQMAYNILCLNHKELSKRAKVKQSYVAKLILSLNNIHCKKTTSTYYNGVIKNFIDNKGKIVGEIVPLDLTKLRETKKDYYKKRDLFYKSEEWRKVRYEVLKEQHGCCQLCGRSRKDGVVLHVDHIIPLSKDWSKRLDKNNLQVLCEDCNIGKSNNDSIDWR